MTLPQFRMLSLTREGGVATLAFNDPATRNAISVPMLEELARAFDWLEDGANGVRCLVLTGTGAGFCAGANLADPDSGIAGSAEPDLGLLLERHYNPLILRMRDLPYPFVTAVNGAAAGIGMSFALMGDIVIAAERAFFLQAFRHIGLVPDGGATWLLPRLVGRARAMELSLLGERLPASVALDWGLINRVVPDDALADTAAALATTLAEGPTEGLALIRKTYWQALENDLETQLGVEREVQREAGRTADFREGVSAFLAKRRPRFKGR